MHSSRIDHDAAKRGMLGVRHPEHACSNGAIVNASGRSRAARAHLVDHSDDVRLALALLRIAFGNGIALFDVAFNESRHFQGRFSHQFLRVFAADIFILHRRSREVNGR